MAEIQNEILFINKLIEKKYIDKNLNSTLIDGDFSIKRAKNKKVDELLSIASKNQSGKQGYPDFIIEDIKNNLLIVVENKEEIVNHYSRNYKEEQAKSTSIKKYAVDGALWYAKHLKDDFNVVAIGSSGKSKSEFKMDTFIWPRKSERWSNINKNDLLNLSEYLSYFESKEKTKTDQDAINRLSQVAQELNRGMRSYLGVSESMRYYLVASILIALEDYDFKIKYSHTQSSKKLLKMIFETASDEFENMKYQEQLKDKVTFIKNISDKSPKNKYPNGYISEMISILDSEVFIHYKESNIDVLSYFFTLFLQYSTSGGAEMGIVLTPPHITNLFSKLANINIKSKILDPCLGTGGFLSAAWKYIYNSNYSSLEKEKFRHNNLMGVEFNPDIYPAAILNMLINKDGKSNFIQGDSFKLFKLGKLKSFGANVGFINPPYSDEVKSEIEFVEIMLDSLKKNSIGIAIIPVNAVSNQTKLHGKKVIVSAKERILNKHKLLASIQMPNNLFYPKGTETIILIFETGVKNENNKTWFSKFDDGYRLIKQSKTRTATEKSEELLNQLVESYRNRTTDNGEFEKNVNSKEQWVYTVLRNNNYTISINDLKTKAKEFAIYKILNDYE